jgi:threonine/homoserine/homoserine lactone efflux protein
MDSPLALYVVASLALILTPGQDMIYVATRSLAQGRFAGVCSALGVIVGILVHTALAAAGVSAILQASESLFLALKLVGAGYLAYLGIRLILSEAPALGFGPATPALRPWSLFWQGVLSNVTNPKIVLFFFAFLPQFVDPAGANPTRELVALGVLYALMGLPVKVGVALAAGTLAARFARSPAAARWINRTSGAILVGLGLKLAATERP